MSWGTGQWLSEPGWDTGLLFDCASSHVPTWLGICLFFPDLCQWGVKG